MAETAAGRFEAWVVSSFNLVVLSLVGLLAAHASGALEGELANFGTLPGVAAFAYLWLLTAAATRWALAGGGLADLQDGLRGLWRLVLRGFAAGALIGAAFLLGVLLVGAILNGAPLLSLAFIALIGVAAASVVGGVIGGLSVVLDAGCYWAAGRLVGPWAKSDVSDDASDAGG
ncbi:hypothetical protein C5B91_05775 [Haloferax sp. Atlit-10N]|uniref:hypothetical protein n=1 Tax=unclassified Haloferax TaxID=2625095 RepID=UPI000E2320F7|nr:MULTISPECIES: hypothetical protein [unclassified Haloferax]RDZ47172.1 hypothetical protein C5B87_05775 [Haloferax sp. Atlit-16N]RDZ61003.1 hypothetical protein C5B91_05775 [Haloferax sp. Atlit-10N]